MTIESVTKELHFKNKLSDAHEKIKRLESQKLESFTGSINLKSIESKMDIIISQLCELTSVIKDKPITSNHSGNIALEEAKKHRVKKDFIPSIDTTGYKTNIKSDGKNKRTMSSDIDDDIERLKNISKG